MTAMTGRISELLLTGVGVDHGRGILRNGVDPGVGYEKEICRQDQSGVNGLFRTGPTPGDDQ